MKRSRIRRKVRDRFRVLPDGREIREGKFWDEQRERCWLRDGKRCVECGKEITLQQAEIDHIRKASLCGGEQLSNLRTLCGGMYGCHAARHRREEGL